jgi:hypothetical protein
LKTLQREITRHLGAAKLFVWRAELAGNYEFVQLAMAHTCEAEVWSALKQRGLPSPIADIQRRAA